MDDIIKEYYQKNKDWLQKIALSGDPIVRAMALAVLEAGAEPDDLGIYGREQNEQRWSYSVFSPKQKASQVMWNLQGVGSSSLNCSLPSSKVDYRAEG